MNFRRSFLQLAAAGALGALLAAPAHAAGSGNITVSAAVLSKSNCKFVSNVAPSLDFGLIDPSSTDDKFATATASVICHGSANLASFSVSANNGYYYSGTSRRMRHGLNTSEFIPYALTFSPASTTVAKNVATDITIQATITPSGFQNAIQGAYSDTVRITLSP